MSLLKNIQKYIKIQDDKKESIETFTSWDFKSHINNLNFDQISGKRRISILSYAI